MRLKLLNIIKRIIDLTDNEVIILGSIGAHLNGIDYGWPIGDIDIAIKDKEIVDKLSILGEVNFFTNNMFEMGRASIRVDGELIDIFIGDTLGDPKTTNYKGLKIKHEKLEDMIEHLRNTINRFDERENKVFFLKFQHKLHKCLDTYNYNRI